jgi:tetraacyldisaccharide 4'-kinase
MGIEGMRTDELWFSSSPAAKLGRMALMPASWLYALGWEIYASTYRLGLKRPQEPFRPVICVGNLVVGGSGKTPATLAVARQLEAMGESVVLSLSGYGSPRSEAATVAPEGGLLAAEWGDEPAMVRWLMPQLPIIVGRRRVLAAELAAGSFPGHVLLMDDGFQHLPLRKHLTMLLDEASPKNTRYLPAGPYREPRRNRAKADLVLGDRFELSRAPLRFITSSGEPLQPPTRASMLCAIGNPHGFEKALHSAGVNLAQQLCLQDHDPLTDGKLLDGLDRSETLVVTAKDWVKLRARADLDGWHILIALQDAEIEPKAEFGLWLQEQVTRVRSSS